MYSEWPAQLSMLALCTLVCKVHGQGPVHFRCSINITSFVIPSYSWYECTLCKKENCRIQSIFDAMCCNGKSMTFWEPVGLGLDPAWHCTLTLKPHVWTQAVFLIFQHLIPFVFKMGSTDSISYRGWWRVLRQVICLRAGVDRLSPRAKSSCGHQFRVIGTFLEGDRERNVWESLFVTHKVQKFALWPFIEKACHFLIWMFEPCLTWLAVLHVVFSSLLPLINLSPGFSLSEHLVQEAPIIQEPQKAKKWRSIQSENP